MSNLKGCFSHQSDLWKTPLKIYNHFIKRGYFDPCPANPQFDGLSIDWDMYNFVNPPYSQIEKWLDKAFIERQKTIIQCFFYQLDQTQNGLEKLWNMGVALFLFKGD